MEAADTVAIPLQWFLGAVGSLTAVIGILGRTIFKVQEERRTGDLASQEKMLVAMRNSTEAINRLAQALGSKEGV
jgi:hypothetical protein